MPNVEANLLLSLKLEKETGYDSIPTIEENYERDQFARIECCFPWCGATRRTAEAMWRHVHFSEEHNRPFGVKTPGELSLDKDYTPDQGSEWVK